MALQRTENAYQDTDHADNEQEEFSKSFVCCVCLDLLYKPIVLSCGHVFCFWCVHQSMSPLCESHCPNCRHQYHHFPTICWMLHFLLLKMYPVPYNRRKNQTLEEEKKWAYYSPQIDDANLVSEVKFDHIGTSSSASKDVFGETPEAFGQQKISVADLMCSACKQILFHPVVLNCGHVYCESCIKNSADDEMLRCQICQLPHPGGFPKVCFELDRFIKEKFPEEHAKQRDAVQLRHINDKPETSSCSLNTGGEGKAAWWSDSNSKVHVGVGCDFCGMFPIVGDRYRCKDCKEKVGFDLCADCYKIRSKVLGGRFNQQHSPEHEFELKQINIIMRLVTGHLGGGSSIEDLHLENSEVGAEDPNLVVVDGGDDGEHTQNDSEGTN